VGTPILDEHLTDVRSTVQAIACANGASSLDSWVAGYHRFERLQLSLWGSRQGQISSDSLREAEERERALSEQELQARQLIASLEHECEQIRKERDNAQRGVQDLQTAVEERSRQADNWRAMYESLKSGGRVTVPTNATSINTAPINSNQQQPRLQSLSLGYNPNKMMRTDQSLTPSYQGHYDAPRFTGQDGRRSPSQPPASSGGGGLGRFQPTNNFGGGNDGSGGANRARSGSTMGGNDSHSSHNSNDGFMRNGFAQSRSNTLPPRPPTKESLSSLLNRSIAPRTSSISTGSFPTNNRIPLQEPVRSTFFAPASLRAVSPAVHMQQQRHGGGMLY